MQMLIRGLGWPSAETQRPGPPGQADPPDAAGVLAGPGLRSAEEELKGQLLALQVVSQGWGFISACCALTCCALAGWSSSSTLKVACLTLHCLLTAELIWFRCLSRCQLPVITSQFPVVRCCICQSSVVHLAARHQPTDTVEHCI